MPYVYVQVASNKYHGSEPLTYEAPSPLPVGTIVTVPLRSFRAPGIVVGNTTEKPPYTVKPITSVLQAPPVPSRTLQLITWLGEYYPSPSGSVVSQFVPTSPILFKQEITPTEPLKNVQSQETPLPPLTQGQTDIVEAVRKTPGITCLIHGDTGTGKTRIYTELAQDALDAGQSVIILTPEIGLTSQLTHNLLSLTAPVITFHSNLTEKQRRTLWLQILHNDQPRVIVGPRSALFVPLDNIGLIIVDEAHDNAYKQDQAPRYHALRVAAKLAQLHNARLILGTATPLISEYYFMQAKKLPIFRLTEIARGPATDSQITVVQASNRDNYSRHSYLSDELIKQLDQTLQSGEQSLIFLNRRGTARIVLCENGDWQALCPSCDIPLTYHGDLHEMRCHTCGHREPPVSRCPVCKSTDIVFRSIGTKALTEALQNLFPEARIQRFDTDNLKAERLEQHFEDVQSGAIDILVGTQMLVKGLDLPNLALVGVVAADSSLYFPDYTAEEQTFQLLTQVIGRVGRGHRQGKIVIQTYYPNSKALQAATTKDWDTFYASQLDERLQHHLPPYYHMLKLTTARSSRAKAQQAAETLKNSLCALRLPIEIVGPAPGFYEKHRTTYQWQLIVRAKKRSHLLTVVKELPSQWTHDLDPLNLL